MPKKMKMINKAEKSGPEAELAEWHRRHGMVAVDEECHFDKLPNEIIQKIFEILLKLKDDDEEDDISKSKKLVVDGNKQTFLNCRLVSSRWKSGMEPELEKNGLSIWKTMSIPVSHRDLEVEPPNVGYLVVFKTEDKNFDVTSAFLPLPLESGGESDNENGNPFPSKCLKITSDLEDPNRPLYSKPSKGTQVIELTPFSFKFGHHLTSLIIKSVTLSPETLIGILGNTPKLKALNLIRVLFLMDLSNCPQLPTLQDLQHVRLVQLKVKTLPREDEDSDGDEDDNQKNELNDWILSPYKEQLLTLDADGRSGIGISSNFANLERLFISHADDPSFLEPNLFLYPRLKSLFLTDVQIKFEEDRMEWLQRCIAPFAETLTELHIDFPRRIHGGLLEVEALFKLSTKSAHKKRNKIVFREMKTLAFSFPLYLEEDQVIREVIKGFPNLETLTFLVRGFEFKVPEADAQKVAGQEEYKKICPRLQKSLVSYL